MGWKLPTNTTTKGRHMTTITEEPTATEEPKTFVQIESGPEALRLLKQAKDSKGWNYRYRNPEDSGSRQCRYFEEGGEPGCIVGHVLHNLGYRPRYEGEGDDRYRVDTIEGNPVAHLVVKGVIEAPRVVRDMFTAAQRAQDDGATWGTSLDLAETVLNAYEAGQANA